MKKNKTSLVYKNIYVYRMIMNILYGMKYKNRFKNVLNLLDKEDESIIELCFGDIYIAQYAKKNHMKWLGMDINVEFIEYAVNHGYNAIYQDILTIKEIPKNDVVIMIGSLYHFINNIDDVLLKMLQSSKKVIISEPIKNLSNNKYLGFLAKKSANAGKGDEQFRFDKTSFIEMLDTKKDKLSFEYKIISEDRDILVVLKSL